MTDLNATLEPRRRADFRCLHLLTEISKELCIVIWKKNILMHLCMSLTVKPNTRCSNLYSLLYKRCSNSHVTYLLKTIFFLWRFDPSSSHGVSLQRLRCHSQTHHIRSDSSGIKQYPYAIALNAYVNILTFISWLRHSKHSIISLLKIPNDHSVTSCYSSLAKKSVSTLKVLRCVRPFFEVFTLLVTHDGTWQIHRQVLKAGFVVNDGLDKIWT